MNKKYSPLWVILGAAVILAGCTCVILAVTGSFLFFKRNSTAQVLPTESLSKPTSLPVVTLPAVISSIPEITATQASSLASTPTVGKVQALTLAVESLKLLQNITVPINDPILLAEGLQGKQNIPATVPAPTTPFRVGDVQTFWASNEDENKFFQVTATLRYAGQHLYFWVENGVPYNLNALKSLVDAFDTKIYPTDRSFFGDEWTPGVDNDPHLYALYVQGLGNVTAGYFSSQDEYPPQVFQYSNAHEMFDINADIVSLSEPYIYSTLAHEFQHMIHWNTDRNEDLWLNEGFSVLAQFLNGYTIGGFDSSYASNPDLELNDWSLDHESNAPHYGGAFLYLDYLLGRFGSKATQAIVNSPLHGLNSIDAVMANEGIKDAQTGKIMTADDIFADWAIANYLHDPAVGDGRFSYPNDSKAPQTHDTESQGSCPFAAQNNQVHQYGVDYIDISCRGNYTLNFTGAPTVPIVPTRPYSGTYDFWSNKGDESDMTLMHAFDFSHVSGSIDFSYHTWYNLEDGYDFVYLEASLDGTHWKIIQTPDCSTANPSGNSYGCGYTGSSNGWIAQTVDLSEYAGKKVNLRFEYLTDAGLNGEGLLLDDISLPQIDYSTDFEKDDGGWKADGFARVSNLLPQTYRVSLILAGQTTSVQYITLDANQSASIPISLGGDVKKAILVVSGSTRFTRQQADYQVSVTP